ncbi:MAG: hypothetical protein J0H44_15525 [Alphaproteobacteria bacterium]|nr:hypothetical protein [Alphaproteobacteria bacterium]
MSIANAIETDDRQNDGHDDTPAGETAGGPVSDAAKDPATDPTDDPASWGEALNEDGAAADNATDEEAEASPDEEEESESEGDHYDHAPAFWSAERKALWERITDPEARQAIHEHEKERVASANRKIEEAALVRKGLEERVQEFGRDRDQLTQWLTEAAPRLARAFQGRWGQYDWNRLAVENPAEFMRLSTERDAEFATIQRSAQQHQQELQAARGRAAQIRERNQQAELGRLAQQHPEHFASDKAQRTFDELGRYLAAQGVPQQLVQNTFESSVVGVALKAMLYDKAQAAVRARNASASGGSPITATQTPRRIAPGPGNRPGHSKGEATRQAEQRLRTGQALSDDDVARLFG